MQFATLVISFKIPISKFASIAIKLENVPK